MEPGVLSVTLRVSGRIPGAREEPEALKDGARLAGHAGETESIAVLTLWAELAERERPNQSSLRAC